jgi:hypothetical protein
MIQIERVALQIQQSGIFSLFDAGILTEGFVGLITAGCLPLEAGNASDRRFFNAFVLEGRD